MKQSERASIFRIASDLIKADAIIDTREIEKLDSIRNKYAIKKEDEILGTSYTFAKAIQTLLDSPKHLRHELMGTFDEIAMSDRFYAREEALLLAALRLSLTQSATFESKIISIDTSDVYVDPTQILYIESEFDNDTNWELNEKYREITTEIRLAGFDFVYIPKIAEHYRSISDNDLLQIAEFLYPRTSPERLHVITKQLQTLSTSEFCKDQLTGKLGIKELASINPSLMIRIGESIVNEKKRLTRQTRGRDSTNQKKSYTFAP